MEKHRKPKVAKSYRFEPETARHIKELSIQWDMDETATVARAVRMIWELPIEEGNRDVVDSQPATIPAQVHLNPDAPSLQPKPAQPEPAPVVHKPAYQQPAEVWVKQPQKKYDPVTGEHREWEKLDRRPWTERWIEGGETDYWPA